jgi:hypothetical protein
MSDVKKQMPPDGSPCPVCGHPMTVLKYGGNYTTSGAAVVLLVILCLLPIPLPIEVELILFASVVLAVFIVRLLAGGVPGIKKCTIQCFQCGHKERY